MKESIPEVSMTRTEFENNFGITPHGKAVAVVLCGASGKPFVKVNLVGHKQYEIEQLERLWKLQGDQRCTKQNL